MAVVLRPPFASPSLLSLCVFLCLSLSLCYLHIFLCVYFSVRAAMYNTSVEAMGIFEAHVAPGLQHPGQMHGELVFATP